jgi:hypothetical protein
MQYPPISLTSIASNLRSSVQFFLLIVISLAIITSTKAHPQASRKNQVTVESQPPSVKRRAAKTKPLRAADHRAAEKRLAELGYWTGNLDGRWDEASRQALIAFQKVEWLGPTGRLTRAIFEILLDAKRPAPLETGQAHIEVDLVRQALFIVDDAGMVSKILPVSSGSGSAFSLPAFRRLRGSFASRQTDRIAVEFGCEERLREFHRRGGAGVGRAFD